jgi:hypothetical protein
MEKLITCLDNFQVIKDRLAAEEQNRMEREAIRQEQADEYERSKAIDRARQEEIQKVRQKEMYVIFKYFLIYLFLEMSKKSRYVKWKPNKDVRLSSHL